MLHILRHAGHTDPHFSRCLNLISPGQSLLLIEDAVYSLLPGTASRRSLQQLPDTVNLYAMAVDLQARGLELGDLPPEVSPVDYPGMVELAVTHDKVLSW